MTTRKSESCLSSQIDSISSILNVFDRFDFYLSNKLFVGASVFVASFFYDEENEGIHKMWSSKDELTEFPHFQLMRLNMIGNKIIFP